MSILEGVSWAGNKFLRRFCRRMLRKILEFKLRFVKRLTRFFVQNESIASDCDESSSGMIPSSMRRLAWPLKGVHGKRHARSPPRSSSTSTTSTTSMPERLRRV